MKSAITNCWGMVPVRSLAVEHSILYRGKPGCSYNHQAQLTSHRGALVASWTLGVRDEEGPGEDMVFAVSTDQGKSWTPPRVVACAEPGRAAKTIVVSSGIRSLGDTLVAYSGHWDRLPEGIMPDGFRTPCNEPWVWADVRTEARVSRDCGTSWSAPVVVAPNCTNYMTPFTTQSGRIILPSNLTFPWTDDPMGLTGWQWSAVPGLTEGVMDNYFNMAELNTLAKTGQSYNEACCYQLADGTLRMMLRNERRETYRLGVSESRDNGLTWSTPVLTEFTDEICRAHFGRLPDGRYFAANCPSLVRPNGYRSKAVLALSKDGTVFDQHYCLGDSPDVSPRQPGLYKGGRFGYPYLHIDGEYGFVIYSIAKEDIGIGRFRLADLA